MGKFESSKSAQERDQVADQFGQSSIPLGLLRPAGDMSPRSTGISVTAGAIGMGLAAQSASQDGLMAFAATLPGADILASLARSETQGPSAKSADVAEGENVGGAFQPDGAAIEADSVDPLQGASFDADDLEMSVAPSVQESQLTSHIGVDGSAIGSVSIQGTTRASTNSSVAEQLNEVLGAAEKVVPTIAVVPGDHLLPEDIAGAEGPVGPIVGSVIGDGDLADGLLDGVLGEGSALDSVLGEDGVVGVLLGEDGLVSGLLGDGGVVGAVLGEDGVVDALLGEDGLVGGVLGDDGVVGGLLGEGGVVDDLLGENGLVQGVLGEDGIVDGLLGEDGLVGGVLGDNGVVGGVLGEDGLVGGLLGDNGLLGGLSGGGSSETTEGVPADLVDTTLSEVSGVLDTGAQTVTQVVDGVIGEAGLVGGVVDGLLGGGSGDESLAGGLLGEDGLIDGLAGEDGLVGGVLGDNGVVSGVLGEDGLVGDLLSDNGLLGGLLGGGSSDPTDVVPADLVDTTLSEVSGVLDTGAQTVTQVVDGVLGEGGLVGGVADDLVGAGLEDESLAGGLLGESNLVEGVLSDNGDGLLGEDGLVGGVLGDDGLVGGLLGDTGVLDGLLGESTEGVPAELADTTGIEASDALETSTETVAQVSEDIVGEDGLVGGALAEGTLAGSLLGDDGVVDDLVGDDGLVDGLVGGLLGGGVVEVEEAEPAELPDMTTPETSSVPEDEALVSGPALNPDVAVGGVVDDIPVVGGVLGGLLSGQAASPQAVEPVVESLGTEPSDDALLVKESVEEGVSSDDGFLDTLVAGVAEDPLASVETLLDPGQTLLDGLLGENDVFGLNVVETDEGDDLFAGLTGEKGLTGSLVEQDVLGLSDPVGGGCA
ncbi:hypothetical protein [Sulfitobacter dubius]|uniref:hypothetical protein n=1 Tax=Sulfitobacter dubius TaxID=218673 RepID=UPI0008EB1C86|nr:hypothetical protein [Sulfitobacter dubius]SFH37723.1 hypothetical protein SAMN04488039_1102 [Sulfitobacter dubius]